MLIGDFLKRVKQPEDIEADKDYKLVTVKLYHKGVTLREIKKGSEIGSKMYRVKAGQFILSGIDARNGAFGIIPDELDGAVVTNDFWYFDIDDRIIDKKLFLYLTATDYFDEICRQSSDGTTNRVRLQADKFFVKEIDLPDIESQRKLLSRLQHSDMNLNRLKTEIAIQEDMVKKLRQGILQDAVQGKLVPQDKSDEPASELLKRIRAEKEALIKQGKLKKDNPLPPIKEDEIPFPLPTGWQWCRLGDLTLLITSGSRDWAKYYSSEGAIFIRMGNLSKDTYALRLDSIQHVKPPHKGEGNRTRLEPNDILISITGEVGNLGMIPSGFGEAYINQHTGLVRLTEILNPTYFAQLFLSPFAQEQFKAPQRGVKNSFRLSDIQFINIPLPPIAEQHRIVAKVDSLMALCKELEEQITTSKSHAEMLMQSVLKEAFSH